MLIYQEDLLPRTDFWHYSLRNGLVIGPLPWKFSAYENAQWSETLADNEGQKVHLIIHSKLKKAMPLNDNIYQSDLKFRLSTGDDATIQFEIDTITKGIEITRIYIEDLQNIDFDSLKRKDQEHITELCYEKYYSSKY